MSGGAPTIPELLEELQGRWRAFTSSDDQRRAEFLLGDAWREIVKIPTLVDRLDDEAVAADARMVACNAVKRAMVAEGRLGVEEEERTDGPIGRRRRYAAASTTAQVELTDDERQLLEGALVGAGDVAAPRWTGDVVLTPPLAYLSHVSTGRPW